MTWHIITGEYPPLIGGVSGYSHLVAHGLANAGDEVHVWCPTQPTVPGSNGVTVHAELGHISRRDLRAVDRRLDEFASPRRLLVQWVPHGFGYRSMNVAFCLWLWRRARRGDRVEIVVHEPYLAFGEGAVRWTAAASVHRVMTMILARAASRIWISIPDWERRWRPYTLGRDVPFTWLPIPNTLPTPNRDDVDRVRARYAATAGPIVGYVGSYGTVATRMLGVALPDILAGSPTSIALLLGRNSDACHRQLMNTHPALRSRIHTSGALSSSALAEHVAACDLLVQPYPDGISSRRTSAMAGLALRVPIVTTRGHLTEPLWDATRSVVLVDVNEPRRLGDETLRLLADDEERARLASRGRDTYDRHFHLSHTIGALRGAGQESCGSRS